MCTSWPQACITATVAPRHIGPQHEHFAWPVFEDANHAVPADAGGHLDAERSQLVGHSGSGLLLLQREFRRLMQMAIEVHQRR
jgi:hypothetical protein